jgi:hypothetical protein
MEKYATGVVLIILSLALAYYSKELMAAGKKALGF